MLVELKELADELSLEDRAGLATHLLEGFDAAPLGPDDEEVDRRDREIDAGEVRLLSHAEFVRDVGR